MRKSMQCAHVLCDLQMAGVEHIMADRQIRTVAKLEFFDLPQHILPRFEK